MSTITPMLDTLLPQVLGRRADMARFTGARVNVPLGPVDPVASVRTDGFDRPTPGTGADNLRGRGRGSADGEAATGNNPASRQGPDKTAMREIAQSQRYLPATRAEGGKHTESARAQLSREGGLIASLLARRDAPVAHTTPAHAAALFGAARVPATPILATILGQQVAHSGLFYESHLSKWFDGQRPFAELLEEPHNQKPQTPAANEGKTPTQASPPAPRQTLSNSAGHALLAPGAFQDASSNARGDGTRGDVVDERLLSVVRQQLDVLSNPVFRWHGAAWPGVDMHWEIHENPDESASGRGDDSREEQASFSTRLHLDLPKLGKIEVALNLASGGIEVYAFASSAQGAAAVSPATGELKERFEQAGFTRAHVELIEDDVR